MAELPIINVLIRTTAGRENEFKRCLISVFSQTYERIRCIVCTDSKEAEEYIRPFRYVLDHIRVAPTGVPFHWNFYCNNLKERVTHGWFFYLDDDDYLLNNKVLENIVPHLNNPNEGVICQFNRGSRPKPVYDYCELTHDGPYFREGVINEGTGHNYIKTSAIVRGKIGGSCIFLHHSQKNIANWDGKKAADYRFIKAVSEKIPLKFIPQVVVQAGNGGRHGS